MTKMENNPADQLLNERRPDANQRYRVLIALLSTIRLYGFAGWAYIALNAVVHPQTLPLQLTHLTPWIREDTFGFICFAASSVAHFSLQLLRRH